jgi:hypothetical protein
VILLSQPPKCWDYWHVHPVQFYRFYSHLLCPRYLTGIVTSISSKKELGRCGGICL